MVAHSPEEPVKREHDVSKVYGKNPGTVDNYRGDTTIFKGTVAEAKLHVEDHISHLATGTSEVLTSKAIEKNGKIHTRDMVYKDGKLQSFTVDGKPADPEDMKAADGMKQAIKGMVGLNGGEHHDGGNKSPTQTGGLPPASHKHVR